MRKSVFTKHLETLDDDQLKESLLTLYSKFPDVKTYFTMELGDQADRKKIIDKTKKRITQLYTHRKTRSRISKFKELLKQFKSVSIFDHETAEVLTHFLIVASTHFLRFNRWKEADYRLYETILQDAILLINKSQTEDLFRDQIFKAIELLDGYEPFYLSMRNHYLIGFDL